MPPNTWPLAAHFSTMLQKPEIAFKNPELKQVKIQTDARNQPLPRSGAFANVYKGTYPGNKGSVAIRVFTSSNTERRERYQAIHQFLEQQRPSLKPLVHFNYMDDGIRSTDGKRYPLVTMEWVSGETLLGWLRKRCIDRDQGALDKVSQLWIDAINSLGAAGIAHGDLQHANVMINDQGELKLVDYDCMCVPALVGRKNLEIGVEPYQHPERNADTVLNLNLDNFSSIFITVALKALAAAPVLWNEFIETPQYDKLLFRREDFEAPTESALIRSLQHSPNTEVRRLCSTLVDLTRCRMDEVPRLSDVLFDFKNIEVLLGKRDFDGAIEMLARSKKTVTEAPAPLQPKLRDAEARVHCRKALGKAVDTGDETAMQKLYQPKLLDDYPLAQPLVAVAKLAPRVLPLLAQFAAIKQASRWRELVTLWDANAVLVSDRKSTISYSALVRTWRERNQACDVVLAILKQHECDANQLDAAWKKLEQLGGHPDSTAQRPTVERYLAREKAWTVFRQIPLTLSETTDRQLAAAWIEPLFVGWNRAETERSRLQDALNRLKLLSEVESYVPLSLTIQNEQKIYALAERLPAEYDYKLRPRVKQAVERLQALQRLHDVLKTSTSDLSITAAWKEANRLGAGPLVSAERMARVMKAERVAAIVEILKPIPPNYPISEAPIRDSVILAAWNEELLQGASDAAAWRATFEAAHERSRALAELKAAIASSDKMKIASFAESSCLVGYPFSTDWSRAIRDSHSHLSAINASLSSLRSGDRLLFLTKFDARVVRSNVAVFTPEQSQLRQWLRTEVAQAEKLKLAPPLARKAVTKESGETKYRVCWNWPEPRVGDQCVLAVCRNRPKPEDDPLVMPAPFRRRISRKGYEDGGGSVILHAEPEWLGCYIVVWALIDLGFETFWSECLVLGRIDKPDAAASKKKFGGLFG